MGTKNFLTEYGIKLNKAANPHTRKTDREKILTEHQSNNEWGNDGEMHFSSKMDTRWKHKVSHFILFLFYQRDKEVMNPSHIVLIVLSQWLHRSVIPSVDNGSTKAWLNNKYFVSWW